MTQRNCPFSGILLFMTFSTQVANQTKVGIFYSNFVVYSPEGEEITAQMNI